MNKILKAYNVTQLGFLKYTQINALKMSFLHKDSAKADLNKLKMSSVIHFRNHYTLRHLGDYVCIANTKPHKCQYLTLAEWEQLCIIVSVGLLNNITRLSESLALVRSVRLGETV